MRRAALMGPASREIMMLDRRGFLLGTGAVSAATIIGRRSALAQGAAFETPLPIPEMRDARAQGGSVDLAARRGEHAFLPGRPTATYGYSRSYLGPTLRFHRGDVVEVSVKTPSKTISPHTGTASCFPPRSMAGRTSSSLPAEPGGPCSRWINPRRPPGAIRIPTATRGGRSISSSPA